MADRAGEELESRMRSKDKGRCGGGTHKYSPCTTSRYRGCLIVIIFLKKKFFEMILIILIG